MNLYPNIPGQLTQFKDGGLTFRRTPNEPRTESILLLGTAVDGPVLEPVAVDDQSIELLFGRAMNHNGSSNGSTLVSGYYRARAAGCEDVRLMRISGVPAAMTLPCENINEATTMYRTQILGTANGNVLTTYQLSQTSNVITASLQVFANSVPVRTGRATVTTAGLVTLQANACDSGAYVTIQYNYTSGAQTISATENGTGVGDAFVPWVAPGANQVFNLTLDTDEVVNSTGAKIYFNGVQASSSTFTINSILKTATLLPGHAPLDGLVELAFIYIKTVNVTPTLKLESFFGGNIYNDTQIKVSPVAGAAQAREITIIKPQGKTQLGEAARTYSTIDFPTLGLLARAITEDPRNTVVQATTNFENVPSSILNPTHSGDAQTPIVFKTMFGGSDMVHLTKDQIYAILGGERDHSSNIVKPGAYHTLENYSVDIIVPLGVFADDALPGKYDNFAYQLALACAAISHRGDTTMGVIATSSPSTTGLVDVQNHVSTLASRNNSYLMLDQIGEVIYNSEGQPFDLGGFISVFAGPDVVMTHHRLGTFAVNDAAGYAGLISGLRISSSPLNKRFASADALRYRLSPGQVSRLLENRYVVLQVNQRNEIVVADGITAARPAGDYADIVNIRTVKEVVNQARLIAEPYLGEPNDTAHRNSMMSAVAKRFDKMQEAGDIEAYDVQIVSTHDDLLLGQTKLEITIVPKNTTRGITIIAGLRRGL